MGENTLHFESLSDLATHLYDRTDKRGFTDRDRLRLVGLSVHSARKLAREHADG